MAGMRTSYVVLIAWCLMTEARADTVWQLHAGGGLEGGMISGQPHPGGVAESGMIVEAILPDGTWGIGASLDAIARTSSRLADGEEIKADLMLRFASRDRRFRFGAGAGLRLLAVKPPVEDPHRDDTIRGYDLMRLDVSGRFASWKPIDRGPRISLEGYFSWTFGCYRDTVTTPAVGDMLPTSRSIGCVDTITSAYVLGLATSFEWK